ncbi:MAG: hypothetical protein KUG52_04615, partial [Immundisolibacteraceae bacterium]|nr:hypothetical protein [Immundisolibacteraceae bacterium]
AGTDTFNVQAAGSINNLDGNGGSDSVALNGTVSGAISGATMAITSAAGIGSTGDAQDIQVVTLSVNANGNVFLNETNNLLIDSINVGANELRLTAGGSLNDATAGNDNVVDIAASAATLRAATGIGNVARLEIVTTTIDAETTAGDIDLAGNGTLQVNNLSAAAGAIQLFTVGDLIIGQGNPDINIGGSNAALNVVSANGEVRLAADPGQTGSFDLVQQGGIASTNGPVILLASGSVLAKNPDTVISVAQAPFVIDAPSVELVALQGFIGSTDGLKQTDAPATTANEFFVSQGGTGEAFLIASFAAVSAATSNFQLDSLFGGVVNTIFGSSAVTNSAAAQASAAAGESQSDDASDDGYIDPALYDLALNIFDIIGPGISLPADQLEEEASGGDLGDDLGDEGDVGLEIPEFGSDEIVDDFGELDVGTESDLIEEELGQDPIDPGFDESFDDQIFDLAPEFEEQDEGDVFDLEEFDEELNDQDEDDDEDDFDEEFNLDDLDILSLNESWNRGFDYPLNVYADNQNFWGKTVVTLLIADAGA